MSEWDESWQFSGDDAALRRFVSKQSGFYVYALCRPDGSPFYIGKGLGVRALQHSSEAQQGKRLFQTNPHKNNVIRKIVFSGKPLTYRIAKMFEDEQEAYDFEHRLIEYYRRTCDGGILTNLAPGIGSARGPAPFSIARHSTTLSGKPENDLDRGTLNIYLQSIGAVESVPIKPAKQHKVRHSLPHPSARSPTPRCAYALIASAAANGIELSLEAQIPRSFMYQNIQGVIENGVCRDILKADMATLISSKYPIDEVFVLNERQITILQNLYGRPKLDFLGLLGRTKPQ